MGEVIPLRSAPAAFARLKARATEADVAADRARKLERLRKILRGPAHLDARTIRFACMELETHGGPADYFIADKALKALQAREKQAEFSAAIEAAQREEQETAVKIAMRHGPQVGAWALGVAAAIAIAALFEIFIL